MGILPKRKKKIYRKVKASMPEAPVEGQVPDMEEEEIEQEMEEAEEEELDDDEGELEEVEEESKPVLKLAETTGSKAIEKPKQTLTLDELLDMVEGHCARAVESNQRAAELIKYIRSVI